MMADNTDPTTIGITSSSGLFGVVASSRKEKKTKMCSSVAKLVEFQETLQEQLVKPAPGTQKFARITSVPENSKLKSCISFHTKIVLYCICCTEQSRTAFRPEKKKKV